MKTVKQYIKNPKFGTGDEPEFIPVGNTGIDVVKNRLLQVERQELNLTIKNNKNYSTLTEAIAAVSDEKYKVKGLVLTFYTGAEWVSRRFNGEDSSGFNVEENWISIYSEDAKAGLVVLGYFDTLELLEQGVSEPKQGNTYGVGTSEPYTIYMWDVAKNDWVNHGTIKGPKGDQGVSGVPVEIVGGSGIVNQEIEPNKYYRFGEVSQITINLKEATEGVYNEYLFQFSTGETPATIDLPGDIKWYKGTPVINANKTYQISITNNLAVLGEF